MVFPKDHDGIQSLRGIYMLSKQGAQTSPLTGDKYNKLINLISTERIFQFLQNPQPTNFAGFHSHPEIKDFGHPPHWCSGSKLGCLTFIWRIWELDTIGAVDFPLAGAAGLAPGEGNLFGLAVTPLTYSCDSLRTRSERSANTSMTERKISWFWNLIASVRTTWHSLN